MIKPVRVEWGNALRAWEQVPTIGTLAAGIGDKRADGEMHAA